MALARPALRTLFVTFLFIVLTITILPVAAQETPTPAAEQFQGTGQGLSFASSSADVVTAIDHFWSGIFSAAGLAYSTPGLISVDQPTPTPCGAIDATS